MFVINVAGDSALSHLDGVSLLNMTEVHAGGGFIFPFYQNLPAAVIWLALLLYVL